MDDRIGQRLLRFLGALPEMPRVPVEGEGGKAKAEHAEGHGEPAPEVPRRISEETVVERYHANPFLNDGEAPTAARQLADQAKADQPESPAKHEKLEKHEKAERSEKKSEAKVESSTTHEKRDVDEAHEMERARSDQAQEIDDRNKVGAGWIAEERAQEESEASKGLRHAQAMGDEERCHGVQSDGNRCLRKPVDGKAYCREHSAGAWPDTLAPIQRAEKRPEPVEMDDVETGVGVKIIE